MQQVPSDFTLELLEKIEAILRNANKGKGIHPAGLSAYQVLARMKKIDAVELNMMYGKSGKGGGNYFSAASLVSQMIRKLPNVRWNYVDTRDMHFTVHGKVLQSGYPVCAFYRLVD